MVPRPNLGGDSIFLHHGPLGQGVVPVTPTHTHTLPLGSFVPLQWLVMSGKGEAPFKPKSFEVHPTNSQSVPLPMMGFEYINGLPPIHYGPFIPKVGIMVHLAVSDLLIYPFMF